MFKSLLVPLLSLALTLYVAAEVITIPVETYSRDSAFTKKDGKATIKLPDGWTFKDQDGRRNLFAGSDMYASISLNYKSDGLNNTGLTQHEKRQINGKEIHVRTSKFGSGFVRVLPKGWRLVGTLSPYKGFKGKDSSAYLTQMLKIVAEAKIQLPGHGNLTDGFLVAPLSEGDTKLSVRFATPSDDWQIQGTTISGPDAYQGTLSLIAAPEGQAITKFIKDVTGSGVAVWNLSTRIPILGSHNKKGGTSIFLRLPNLAKDYYIQIESDKVISHELRKKLMPMLNAIVIEKA